MDEKSIPEHCNKCGNTGMCLPQTLESPDGQQCDCNQLRKPKNKIIYVIGGNTASTSAMLHSIKESHDKVVLIENENKKQISEIIKDQNNVPYRARIEMSETKSQLNDAIVNKPLPDWNKKNYQQRNKKYKTKRSKK